MSVVWNAFRGAVAGVVGTYVMDVVTTRVLDTQSAADTAREKAAWPNGKPSVENLVDLGSRVTGFRVPAASRPMIVDATHYALGAIPGMGYALLRHRIPLLGAGRGAVYGLLLFVVNDELLNTALGLSGPPDAYPMSSHLRGLIGHLALGITTDLALTGV